MPNPETAPQKRGDFVRAWALTLRAWRMWARMSPGFFASTLLSAACEALGPYLTIWLSAQVISELAGVRDARRLAFWAGLTVAAGALTALLNGALKRWAEYARDRLSAVRFKPLADKMTTMDYAAFDRQEVQDAYSQILQNDNWMGHGLFLTIRLFSDFTKAALQVLGGVGFTLSLFLASLPLGAPLAWLNGLPAMALVLGAMAAAVAASSACGNRATLLWSRQGTLMTLGNRYFNFFGVAANDRKRAADMRMYNQQENICRPYMLRDNMFRPGSPLDKALRGPIGLLRGLSQALSALLTCAVYLYVCLKAWGGAFGVGQITRYVGAATQLFGGVALLLKALGEMRANGGFLAGTFDFLDQPNPMYRGSLTTEKRSDGNYQIEFRDVSFRYPGAKNWALRHVNLRFRVGSRLAVVGRNGSGKTTFIKLLCRLYDPTEGQILLNGIDIRKYRYEDYIGVFSVVFQDFSLLALPLGENVAGTARYDPARAEGCLRSAGFADRLAGMPRGLETALYKDLDKEGVELSGGEAQKVAMARALYKNAPFLVLDEPTAALDPVAEAEVYEKFDALAGGKTAVYISHRLSSCKFCDRIAVFDEGSIVQTGRHEDLLAAPGSLYARLWHAQAQYYTKG